jgi:hypothetical protein
LIFFVCVWPSSPRSSSTPYLMYSWFLRTCAASLFKLHRCELYDSLLPPSCYQLVNYTFRAQKFFFFLLVAAVHFPYICLFAIGSHVRDSITWRTVVLMCMGGNPFRIQTHIHFCP